MRFTVYCFNWRPGGYLVTLRAERGDDFVGEHHSLIRCAPARANAIAGLRNSRMAGLQLLGRIKPLQGIAGRDANAFHPSFRHNARGRVGLQIAEWRTTRGA